MTMFRACSALQNTWIRIMFSAHCMQDNMILMKIVNLVYMLITEREKSITGLPPLTTMFSNEKNRN